MKLYEIYNAHDVLKKLSDNDGMTIRECYALNHLLRDLAPDLEFFSDRYNKLLQAYGTQQNGGNQYVIDPERQDDYRKALDELINTESKVRIDKVSVNSELRGITPKEAAFLEPFIAIKEG